MQYQGGGTIKLFKQHRTALGMGSRNDGGMWHLRFLQTLHHWCECIIKEVGEITDSLGHNDAARAAQAVKTLKYKERSLQLF